MSKRGLEEVVFPKILLQVLTFFQPSASSVIFSLLFNEGIVYRHLCKSKRSATPNEASKELQTSDWLTS